MNVRSSNPVPAQAFFNKPRSDKHAQLTEDNAIHGDNYEVFLTLSQTAKAAGQDE